MKRSGDSQRPARLHASGGRTQSRSSPFRPDKQGNGSPSLEPPLRPLPGLELPQPPSELELVAKIVVEKWGLEATKTKSKPLSKPWGISKRYRARKKPIPFFKFPEELRDAVFDHHISRLQSTATKQGDSSRDLATSTYFVKQVYDGDLNGHKEWLKKPPYALTDHFLETPLPVQLVSKKFADDYYKSVLRNAFQPQSIIRTTVADFNFEYINAFFMSLTSLQVEKINNKQVTVIVSFKTEGLACLNFQDLNITAFNEILLKRFRLEDQGEDESVAAEERDDFSLTAENHSISFEYIRSAGMSPPEDVDIIKDWQHKYPHEMRLLGPFFVKWEEENPYEAN